VLALPLAFLDLGVVMRWVSRAFRNSGDSSGFRRLSSHQLGFAGSKKSGYQGHEALQALL
jgi:hypothetical protein